MATGGAPSLSSSRFGCLWAPLEGEDDEDEDEEDERLDVEAALLLIVLRLPGPVFAFVCLLPCWFTWRIDARCELFVLGANCLLVS